MRRVFFLLLAAAVALGVAWVIAGLPGQVEAHFGPYDIAASAPVAALAGLLAFAVLYVIVRLFGLLLRAPRLLARRRERRRRRRGDQAVTRALVALAAGEGGDARREALRARRLLGETPQVLLLAAEAGRQSGRDGEEAAAFELLAGRKDAALLGLRGLLRRAVEQENWPAAAQLARRAEAAHPGATWLKRERFQLAIRTGAWAEALALAGPDAPRAALATAAAEAEPDQDAALRLARRAFEADPSLAPAALAYARRLRAAGRVGRAEEVISRAWRAAPHPDLASFALAPASDALGRMRAATALTKANPDHAESHLLLARTALDDGLVGEARRHAEAARGAIDQRRVFLLLADIAEAESSESGRAAQRDALRRAALAAPDPAWECMACGTRYAAWQAACAHCHAAGRIGWHSSPAPSLLPPQEPTATQSK